MELICFLEERFGWEFNREDFDDRFLLQKYVFFAQELGYPTDYSYNVYIFGAYSPDLTEDYFDGAIDGGDFQSEIADDFDTEAFDSLIFGREPEWLEIASTAMIFYQEYQLLSEEERRKKVVAKTSEEKGVPQRKARSILDELEGEGLLNG